MHAPSQAASWRTTSTPVEQAASYLYPPQARNEEPRPHAADRQAIRKRIRRLMRLRRRLKVYQKLNTSQSANDAKRPSLSARRSAGGSAQSCLLHRHLIPTDAKEQLHFGGCMNWLSSKILVWWISHTQEVDFCIVALNEVVHRFGPLEIMIAD